VRYFVGKSRDIIENLIADLETYIDDSNVMYEKYRELPEDLENRKITVNARIAMYMDSEQEVIKYGAEKPADSRQQINFDISVIRGYRNENADNAELRALDLKDKIIDWIKQLDAFTVSDSSIHSFGYDSSSGFTRKKQYITMTLRCSGQRDLLTAQT
jgi:hypothetical protein